MILFFVCVYVVLKNNIYLEVVGKVLDIFDNLSFKGGVLVKFLNFFDWYEEYFIMLSSFVFNGFIYFLIGLYDFK